MLLLLSLFVIGTTSAVPIELKDDGDGLTGPQPSIIGSLDKVFNKVNKFDQYQCLQKMICEAMGTAEDLVVAGVNSQFGQQGGQIAQTAQSGFNQLQSNPNQFVQTQLGQGSPLVQAATAQLGPSSQGLFQSGQQVFQSGQQFLNSGQQFIQQFPSQQNNVNQFQTNFRPQNQFQQGQFVAQNQFGQTQFGQNQFSSQSQFGQNQFGQSQFGQNQFGQSQFGQSQRPNGGIVDFLVDGLAGMLASVPLPGKRRRRRETTMHGQAIRLMQNLGLANMGAYPYVRAAIIGHANKASPGSCAQLYIECPSGSDQLLSYFNNHNGGLGQNVVPSVTNEVGSLFPGLAALPQVAASTFGEFASSSSNNGAAGGGGGGLVDTVLDTVAGLIAGATLPNQANGKTLDTLPNKANNNNGKTLPNQNNNNGKTLDKSEGKSLPESDRTGAS